MISLFGALILKHSVLALKRAMLKPLILFPFFASMNHFMVPYPLLFFEPFADLHLIEMILIIMVTSRKKENSLRSWHEITD